MDGWGELQQLQQPSLGATLSAPPSQQQAMGSGPPKTPQDYERRVQGWTTALQDLVSNPAVSSALLQMGAALSAGRSPSEAMADAAGAVGRVGMMQEKMRQQQGLESRQARQDQLAERRFGLDERELGMREKLMTAQMERMGRMGAGGGGGRGAAAPGGQEAVLAAFNECMLLPGATEERCREAAIRKVYKSGTTAYTPWGGEQTQNIAKQDMSRQQFLEEKEMEARLFGQELPKPMQEELDRLRSTRGGAPAPAPAVSVPGGGTPPQAQSAPTGGGFDRPGLAEGVRNGNIKLGDTVPLNDGTRLQITPAVYAKLKSETTGGY